jgi:hypothetical protein
MFAARYATSCLEITKGFLERGIDITSPRDHGFNVLSLVRTHRLPPSAIR